MSPAAAPPHAPADHLDHGRFSWPLLVSPLAQNAFLMTTPPAQNLPHCYSLVPVSELICLCVCTCALSVQLCDPHHASLSLGFFRQESWSGLLFPTPGDLPDPRMKPRSPALAGRFFTTEPSGSCPVAQGLPRMCLFLRHQEEVIHLSSLHVGLMTVNRFLHSPVLTQFHRFSS
ncbi:hypothetical protein MJT46_000750 [Ovis ammon polii x Ovis aries]|nr:hypothetical protein MJT46_000750 [Ovis ammon polii x Ovis aries]